MGALIRRTGLASFACFRIGVIVALRTALNAVCPMDPRIEPLRRIRSGDLGSQHVTKLFIKRAGIPLACKITGLETPIGPTPRHAVEQLPGRTLRSITFLFRQGKQRLHIRLPPLQPYRNPIFRHRARLCRHPRLTKVFLSQDIQGHLRPAFRNLDRWSLKDNRSIWIHNPGSAPLPLKQPPNPGDLPRLALARR